MERPTATDRLVDEVGINGAGTRVWFAGILFTYRCTIACRHCLFGCGPHQPDKVMDADRCVRYLGDLHRTGRLVHIAGGEAMLYWDELAAVIEAAFPAGVAPHFIETNCSFAGSDRIVSDRLGFLKAHGVRGLYASACPYHQEHVAPDHFLRVRRMAREIFGPQNVMAPGASEEEIRALAGIARDEERLRQHVRQHPPMMSGAAARRLAAYLDPYPIAGAPVWQGWTRPVPGQRGCRGAFASTTLTELHIDPYDHILTNCGVALGDARRTTPADVLAQDAANATRFTRLLSGDGPWGLVEFARREHGFEPPPTAVQGCELCYRTRAFLQPLYPLDFGPGELYR